MRIVILSTCPRKLDHYNTSIAIGAEDAAFYGLSTPIPDTKRAAGRSNARTVGGHLGMDRRYAKGHVTDATDALREFLLSWP